MNSAARVEFRTAAVYDARLSMAACRAYMVLDDMGGAKGVAFPGIPYLQAKLGNASKRAVKGWLSELEGRYITSVQRSATRWDRVLRWSGVHPIAPQECKPVKSEVQCATPLFLINEPVLEPVTKTCARNCQTCSGSGLRGYPELGGGACDCPAGEAAARRFEGRCA